MRRPRRPPSGVGDTVRVTNWHTGRYRPVPAAVLAGTLLALAGLAAGCTGPAAGTPVPAGPTGAVPSPAAGVFVVESRTLGAIVIDGEGYVLYRSDADRPHPSTSTCLGACTALWRPVPARAGLRAVGIDRQLVGTVARPDGTVQLTLAGWPLYGFAGDRLPGDTNGQGRDGQWYVIGPDGARAGETS